MAQWNSKLKWFLLLNIFLSDVVFSRGPLLQRPQSNLWPITSSQSSLPESQIHLEGGDVHPAHQLVLNLSASLKGLLHIHSNASCVELANGSWRGNGFSQELLGLAMVPVLVSARCLVEAQELVRKLYTVLGQEDTHELVQDVLILIKRGKERESTNAAHYTFSNTSQSTSSLTTILSQVSEHHLQALIFNINQLAELGKGVDIYEGEDGPRGQCKGWVRVKGTQLLGVAAEQLEPLRLDGAQKACRHLGLRCAGVTQDGSYNPEYYRVILRTGSRVVPSSSSESWIQNCKMAPVRWRRNTVPQNNCTNKKEKQVYTVVEWIPAVSTLYNLGTAVYYASVNCYDTAKERAILSTVDLGTDALMVVTGGTAGVAGYAFGAGLKTGVKAGVKYLLNSMKEEDDLLMNTNSWEDGTLNVQ
ncbi:hypothetical protein E1301_Tti016431 [Triplophysa tibetana]|uniref:Apolipoprotein F n=1 Tax=Triplophysa tibetana TaxID=1572043 RepID=A0A5A9NSB0_9TELE|nr:hypothetical protein E1301_Tti016431 [Triplophysa tibetana]